MFIPQLIGTILLLTLLTQEFTNDVLNVSFQPPHPQYHVKVPLCPWPRMFHWGDGECKIPIYYVDSTKSYLFSNSVISFCALVLFLIIRFVYLCNFPFHGFPAFLLPHLVALPSTYLIPLFQLLFQPYISFYFVTPLSLFSTVLTLHTLFTMRP